MRTGYLWLGLLIAGIFLETAFMSFWRGSEGYYLSAWIHFLAIVATLVGGAGLLLRQEEHVPGIQNNDSSPRWTKRMVILLLWSILTWILGREIKQIAAQFPIDPMASDIIPALKIYVERFRSGVFVYQLLEFPGWSYYPTYLPMQWMPYVIAEWLGLDYRFFAFMVFALVLLLWQWRHSIHQDWVTMVIGIILPYWILQCLVDNSASDLGYTVELLIVAWYLFLGLAVFKNAGWNIPAILLTLLSRYIFTFWLPVYALAWLNRKGWKPSLVVVAGIIAGVLLLYVIPFLSKDWTLPSKVVSAYDGAAYGLWEKPAAWQAPGEPPFYLTRGVGFNIYVYDWFKGDPKAQFAAVKKINLYLGIGFAAFLFALWWWKRKVWNARAYWLLALKAYISVFLCFFPAPFTYLWQIPLFLSAAIWYEWRHGLKSIFPAWLKST
jgi:hypothetical protein